MACAAAIAAHAVLPAKGWAIVSPPGALTDWPPMAAVGTCLRAAAVRFVARPHGLPGRSKARFGHSPGHQADCRQLGGLPAGPPQKKENLIAVPHPAAASTASICDLPSPSKGKASGAPDRQPQLAVMAPGGCCRQTHIACGVHRASPCSTWSARRAREPQTPQRCAVQQSRERFCSLQDGFPHSSQQRGCCMSASKSCALVGRAAAVGPSFPSSWR